MKNNVAIYVPGQFPSLKYEALKELSRIAGGATSTPGEGAWVNTETQQLELEHIDIVRAFVPSLKLQHAVDAIHSIGGRLIIRGEQAYAYEINGEFDIDDGKDTE